jgi:hypothetical protein
MSTNNISPFCAPLPVLAVVVKLTDNPSVSTILPPATIGDPTLTRPSLLVNPVTAVVTAVPSESTNVIPVTVLTTDVTL